MELLKAIYQRRAVREFSDATVTPALVHDLLHAAAQAPSALNLQPWSFAVFHGRARLADYSRRAKRHLLATSAPTFGLDPRIDHYANPDANLFHGADTLVVICAKPGPFASRGSSPRGAEPDAGGARLRPRHLPGGIRAGVVQPAGGEGRARHPPAP